MITGILTACTVLVAVACINEVNDLKDQVNASRATIAHMKERQLRLVADLETLRKRVIQHETNIFSNKNEATRASERLARMSVELADVKNDITRLKMASVNATQENN